MTYKINNANKHGGYSITLQDLSNTYIYKSLLHNGYLICKEDGNQQRVVVDCVFKTKLDAEAYIALRTTA